MTNVQLIPFRRVGSYEEALVCFRGGDPHACLSLLSNNATVQTQFLKSRAFLRVGRADLAKNALSNLENLVNSASENAELRILRAMSSTLMREFDEAQDELDLARVYAFEAAPAVEADYQYTEAFLAFAQGDLRACIDAANDVLGLSQIDVDPNPYFVELRNSRIRALIILGMVEGLGQRYDRQLERIHRALADAMDLMETDRFLLATLLEHLSIFVRDFAILDDTRILRDFVAMDVLPHSLSDKTFEIHRALGWSSSLNGDVVGAFRSFRNAAEIASTTPRKILAAVDRAFLSRELGERLNSSDQIDYAIRLAENFDWETTSDDRMALVHLAQESAAFSSERAEALLARYKTLKSKLPPNSMNATDRRPRAYERMAEGIVLRSMGRDGQSIESFIEAFEIWNSCSNQWRSATAAIELAELTQATTYIEFSRKHALSRPGSWLARRFERLNFNESKLVDFRRRS